LGSHQTVEKLKKKAPQIIVIAIALTLTAYIAFEIIEDVVIKGESITSGPLIGAIVAFLKNITATVSSWGYAGVFGLMLLEASSLPVPSEVILPFAGYLISTGLSDLTFWPTVLVATVAALIGSLIDYYIGYKGVEILLKYRVLGRSVFSMEQLEYAGGWFKKYGSPVVFLARLVPGLRTIISFPAGAAKMSLVKFVAFTTAGCVLWNAVLIYVGYYLGVNWREVADVSHYVIYGVVAALVVSAAAYLLIRRRRRKKRMLEAKNIA
jgi:membrane protein DedA with SNARE-associated domain